MTRRLQDVILFWKENQELSTENPSPSHESPENYSETDRLVFFSDAVIAIAITLLVLDIRVPRAEALPAGETLVTALIGQWPVYLSFVISFIIIGETWANHHAMFRYIKRTDHGLLVISIMLLLCIAFIPFAASLLAEYIQRDERAVGAFVYGITLTVGGVFFNLIWWYALRHPYLLNPATDAQELQAMGQRFVIGPIIYLVATLLAFVSAYASIAIFVGLTILFFLPSSAPHKR